MEILQTTAITAGVSACISAVVAFVLSHIRGGAEKQLTNAGAMQEGMRCLMRQQIMDAHTRATSTGFITYAEHAHIKQVYEAYHALGGNGSATELMRDIDALPVHDGVRR